MLALAGVGCWLLPCVLIGGCCCCRVSTCLVLLVCVVVGVYGWLLVVVGGVWLVLWCVAAGVMMLCFTACGMAATVLVVAVSSVLWVSVCCGEMSCGCVCALVVGDGCGLGLLLCGVCGIVW